MEWSKIWISFKLCQGLLFIHWMMTFGFLLSFDANSLSLLKVNKSFHLPMDSSWPKRLFISHEASFIFQGGSLSPNESYMHLLTFLSKRTHPTRYETQAQHNVMAFLWLLANELKEMSNCAQCTFWITCLFIALGLFVLGYFVYDLWKTFLD